jgi:tetratricopeptide (TPR) repeat protein
MTTDDGRDMTKLLSISFVLLATVFAAGCSSEHRAQRYMERGLELYQKGDLAKARLEFRNVLQIDPNDAEAWFMLAKLAEQQEEWTSTYSAYEKTVELAPENWEARVKLGTLLLADNRPDDALAQAEAVLEANPKDPAALALRGTVRLRQGDVDAALTDAETALLQDPALREALALRALVRIEQQDLPAAKASLNAALEAHPDNLRLMLALAGISDQLGDSEETKDILQQIIELEPEVFAHRTRLAQYLNARGDSQAAEQVMRQAVADLPDATDAKLALVALLDAQQGGEPALAQLESFITEAPEDHALRFALAARHSNAGETEQAEAVYREIMARDGDGSDALRARAQLAALALGAERLEDARALAAEVLAKDAENSEALLIRAALALQAEDPDADRAIADLRTILRNEPESTGALRMLATAHEARNEPALAQDAFQRVIELAPDDPAGYLQLAGLRRRIGDIQGAASTLNELLGRDPSSPLAQTALARIQQLQPDTDQLEETAQLIIETRPEDPLGHYLSGLVQQRRGDAEASVAPFVTSLEKNPKAAQPLVALTRSLMALQYYEEAEQRLLQSLEQGADEIVAINLLGEVYVAAGRPDEARAQFEKAIAARPGAPLAYQRLAGLQAAAGDPGTAAATLRKGIKASQGSLLLTAALPPVLEQAGRIDEAIAAYEEVLVANANADWAANNLAMLLVSHRADDTEALDRALTLAQRFENSEEPAFLDTLGWVYYHTGDYDRAAALMEKAQAAGEPTPQRRYHLGMTYLKLGRAEDAKPLLMAAAAAEQPFTGLDEARAILESL